MKLAALSPKTALLLLLGLVPDNHRFHLDFTVHWTELYKQVILGVFGFGNNNTKLQALLHLFEFGSVSLPEDIVYPSGPLTGQNLDDGTFLISLA